MLTLLSTPESVYEWCAQYLTIFFLGAAGFTYYNILSGILRGMGDSFSALGFLLLSTVLNIALDVWFVASFGMGVPGVALATIIAQAISAVFCFIKLMHMRDVFDLNWQMLRLRKEAAWRIVKLGVPSGITQGIMSVSMLVVQALTNSMGEVVMACNVIIMRVDGFAMMPNMSFGQAMSVYTGQNVGAGKLGRVESGMKQGGLLALGVSAGITMILLFFGRYMFELFTDTAELMDLAVRMMRILAFGYIAVSVTQVLGGVMRGAGDTATPMWISMVTTIALRIPVAYGLAWLTRSAEYPKGAPQALFISLLVSWVLGAVITYVCYRKGSWRKKATSVKN